MRSRGTLAVMQNTTFLHFPAIRNAFIGDQSHGDRRHTQPSCFHAACTLTVASHWRVSRISTLPQSSTVKPRRCKVLYEENIRRERPLGARSHVLPDQTDPLGNGLG